MAKTALITGGTAGIGRAAAIGIARKGFDVVVTGRDVARSQSAAEEIRREAGAGTVRGEACDLTSLQTVRRFADALCASRRTLDVLVLNAGTFNLQRLVTADGYEATFAGRFLGHVLLTELLLPALLASGDGRIVVTGGWPRVFRIDFDDLQCERGYTWSKAGNNAFSALILYALDLAARTQSKGLSVNFMHPGYIATGLFKEMSWPVRWVVRTFGASPEKGADTIVYLATEPSLRGVTGGYFKHRRQHRFGGMLANRENQVFAREVAERLLGLEAPRSANRQAAREGQAEVA
jgi:retinol dehydrogenase 14